MFLKRHHQASEKTTCRTGEIFIARLSEELNKNINNPIKIRGNSLTDISPKNIHDWPIKT